MKNFRKILQKINIYLCFLLACHVVFLSHAISNVYFSHVISICDDHVILIVFYAHAISIANAFDVVISIVNACAVIENVFDRASENAANAHVIWSVFVLNCCCCETKWATVCELTSFAVACPCHSRRGPLADRQTFHVFCLQQGLNFFFGSNNKNLTNSFYFILYSISRSF